MKIINGLVFWIIVITMFNLSGWILAICSAFAYVFIEILYDAVFGGDKVVTVL